jgi:hypothetical protein
LNSVTCTSWFPPPGFQWKWLKRYSCDCDQATVFDTGQIARIDSGNQRCCDSGSCSNIYTMIGLIFDGD